MIWQAIKWAYSDSLKHIVFMVSVFVFLGSLFTFVAYPVETVATLVIGFAVYVLFTFFSEWK